MSGETLVQAQGLRFAYPNGVLAVDDLNLEIGKGEIVSIVGPSGCGKSTLLGLLAGFHAPDSGLVQWNNQVIEPEARTRQPRRRRLSLVFQQDTLLPWRTVEQNIAFGLQYVALSTDDRRERIESLVRMGGLQDFRKAYPRELSGGMRRRVAFLTGIAPYPHLLLLDEPFSALDEPTRVALHADVLRITYELGLTVVLVTHDLGEAVSLGDRVHVLSARPAKVAWTEKTELGRPRDVFTLRTSPRYSEVYANTWRELWRMIPAEEAKSAAEPMVSSGFPDPSHS